MKLSARILCATAMALCAASAVPASAQTVTSYNITGTAPSDPTLPFNGTFSLTNNGGNYTLSAFNGIFAGNTFNLTNTGLFQSGNQLLIGGTACAVFCVTGNTNDFYTGYFDPSMSTSTAYGFASNTKGFFDSANFKISAVSAVPEPATWALMLLGFGGIGYSMRRRKAQTKLSFA